MRCYNKAKLCSVLLFFVGLLLCFPSVAFGTEQLCFPVPLGSDARKPLSCWKLRFFTLYREITGFIFGVSHAGIANCLPISPSSPPSNKGSLFFKMVNVFVKACVPVV